MSTKDEPSEFEMRTRALLEESVARVDGRIRSRLTQARYAALEEARRKRHGILRNPAWLPAFGTAAAAVLVAIVLWTRAPVTELPTMAESSPTAFDDLDMLADADALELMEDWDQGFYEWAAAEALADGASI